MSDQLTRCPICGELISPEVLACPHCKSELRSASAVPHSRDELLQPARAPFPMWPLVLALAVVLFVGGWIVVGLLD
jgi:hypothetical protein